jgi:hypothetical protein
MFACLRSRAAVLLFYSIELEQLSWSNTSHDVPVWRIVEAGRS